MVDVQQPAYDPADMTGIYEMLQQGIDPSGLPPIPQNPDQPYGSPAVTRDVGPQSLNTPSPLAVALAQQGGMQPIAGQMSDMGAQPQQSPGFGDMLASALAGGTPSEGSRYNPQTGEFLPAGSYPPPSAAPPPAAHAAAANGIPIAGQQSDTEGEDAYTAGLRTMHNDAVATRRQAQAAADKAAAAGLDPSAYLKIADEAHKEAYDLNMKALEYQKPETTGKITEYEYGLAHPGFNAPAVAPRPITDEERATWGTPGQPLQGAYTISPGEAPKPISGSAAGASEPLDQLSTDYLAARLSKGDNTALTGLGYSKVGAENRARVITRAAAMGTEQGKDANTLAGEQIANQVGLGGEKQGARTMGALGARINTFAEEAKQTGAEALNASADLPRDAWVPIEQIIQMGQSATNNPKFVRLLAANNGIANTYAKAVNPSGIPTDEGRRAAFEILNVARSSEGYAAGVRQLMREANIVQNAIGTVRGQYGTPQGGTVSAPVPSGAPARIQGDADFKALPPGATFIAPDGSTRVKH